MERRSALGPGQRLRHFVSVVVFGLLAAGASGCSSAATPAPRWQAPESLPWRERIDQEWPYVDAQIGQAVRDRRIVGAEVLIVTPEGWSARGFGTAVGQAPPDERTLYEIGSVSKVFTGTILADMARRGEVDPAQPAETLLPKGLRMPQTATRPITLLDLTTHMSGFPRLPPNLKKKKGDPYADFTTEDLYDALGQTRLHAEPGVQNEYSNYGVGLLGQLLVNRAGVADYEALLRQRITDPLGMSDTRVLLGGEQNARFAWAHNARLERNSPWAIPALAGAGGIRSTARDMAIFLQAVMRPDSPISEASRIALTPQGTPKKGDYDQGFGWAVRRDRSTAWHNGKTGGYHTYLGLDLRGSVAVLVLCNTASKEVDKMGSKILKKVRASLGSQPIGPAAPPGAAPGDDDPSGDDADDEVSLLDLDADWEDGGQDGLPDSSELVEIAGR